MTSPNDPRYFNPYSWVDHANEGYHKIQERRWSSTLIGLIVVAVIALIVVLIRR